MTSRLAFSMAIVPVLAMIVSAGQGRCEEAPLAACFQEEPAGALVRQIASERPARDAAAGLAIVQKRSWLPRLKSLLIETTVTNRSGRPLALPAIHVGDWSFRLGEGQDFFRYRELSYRNDTWYGSTYWTGPDWTRVGKDWHHPGENTPSVRRFIAPRDGRITIREFKRGHEILQSLGRWENYTENDPVLRGHPGVRVAKAAPALHALSGLGERDFGVRA